MALKAIHKDRDGNAVLLRLLNHPDRYTRRVAAEELARRNQPMILQQLGRPGTWLAHPGRLRERFDVATVIADRMYSQLPLGKERESDGNWTGSQGESDDSPATSC